LPEIVQGLRNEAYIKAVARSPFSWKKYGRGNYL